ncbi:hypothetical protein EG329_005583 [Mollisiaceae sp. DMI_Dod_QoI]|nr:hypothetical protein EG329_005583 [Helotiales sp. DMI_Dod_QoI]
MSGSLDERSPPAFAPALQSPSPVWDDRRWSLTDLFEETELDTELSNFYDKKSASDDVQASAQPADNIDPSPQDSAGPGECIEDSTAGQQESATTSSMFPQGVQPRSDEQPTTTENPKTAATLTPSKRVLELEENEHGTTQEGDRQWEHGMVKRELDEIQSRLDSLNKRLKYSHVTAQFGVKSTPLSTEPIRANDTPTSNSRGIGNDHPGEKLDTYDKVNDHFENKHFGRSKQSSVKGRRRNNGNHHGNSTQGDNDSRLDCRSQNGKGPQNAKRGQLGGRTSDGGQSYSNTGATGNQHVMFGSTNRFTQVASEDGAAPRPTENTLLTPGHPSLQDHTHTRALGDLATDLKGLSQERQLVYTGHPVESRLMSLENAEEDPQRALLGSGREEPPVYVEIVTKDGQPQFITRTVTPPRP